MVAKHANNNDCRPLMKFSTWQSGKLLGLEGKAGPKQEKSPPFGFPFCSLALACFLCLCEM